MCIKPTAEKSADCYLSKLGAKRLPKFIRVARRPRPDIADWVRKVSVAAGIKAGRKSRFEAIETTLERKQAGVVASLLTTCAFDGTYDMIGFAFWRGHRALAHADVALLHTGDATDFTAGHRPDQCQRPGNERGAMGQL
jgi:hypothetical protein